MRDNRYVTRLMPQGLGKPSPLLLIDDDCSLASLVADYCSEDKFTVTSAVTGEEGVVLARQQHFVLVILDVMLPGIDGFEVLKRLRRSSNIPVLMLTTRGAAMDRVQGLESGADDYLAKPFQPEELVARIKSILRRVHPKETPSRYIVGDITVDETERSVALDGQRLNLTGSEFQLLTLLLTHLGDPLSREELVPRVFGRDATSLDRSIDNLVNNLRRKLGMHPDGADRIKSVRNIGYTYVSATVGVDAQ